MQAAQNIAGPRSLSTPALVEQGAKTSSPSKQMQAVRSLLSEKIADRSDVMPPPIASVSSLPTYTGKGSVSDSPAPVGQNFSALA